MGYLSVLIGAVAAFLFYITGHLALMILAIIVVFGNFWSLGVLSTEAKAAPAVWAARITGTEKPNISAVCICNAPNTTFELVLLPVIKAPIAPIHGETRGNSGPVARARPSASICVIPVCSMISAMLIMERMLTLDGITLRTVPSRMRRIAPD